MNRRRFAFATSVLLAAPFAGSAAAPPFAPVVPGRVLRFPDDEGSHPEFRTEWWYITGWLGEAQVPIGFQITFFRTRPHADSGNPSRFDPKHLLIAHAAISEPAHGRLRHAQRIARAGFGLAQSAVGRLDIALDGWSLAAQGERYLARIPADEFELALEFQRTQPPLLQGDRGYSRKGPHPRLASYYYSHPHLRVQGSIRSGKQALTVSGQAWFDHEWSSEILAANAVGWDWMGINLDDGASLMAFRLRTKDGDPYWAGATHRSVAGEQRTFAPSEIAWMPRRIWRSPRTGADYPVAMRVRIGDTTYDIEPLFDDQENDTRITTGAIYWEGAVTAKQDGRALGRGYLELTGYAGRLRM